MRTAPKYENGNNEGKINNGYHSSNSVESYFTPSLTKKKVYIYIYITDRETGNKYELI